MTVSQLKAILEELEKAGAGDYQIKFCCKERQKPTDDGMGVLVLSSRTFDFFDSKYDFKFNSYLTNNGQYPCKTIMCTDNIELTQSDETVTFYQT